MSSSIQQKNNKPTKSKPTTKRRKVAKACLFCKRSHMTCDDSRPCTRCLKREIGHLCCDEPPSAVERSNLLSTLNNNNNNNQIETTTTTNQQTKLNDSYSTTTTTLDSINRPINNSSLSHLTSLFSPSSSDSPLNNNAFNQSLAFFRASNNLQLSANNDGGDQLESTLFEGSKMTPEPRNEESMMNLNEFLNTYPGLFSTENSSSNHHTTNNNNNDRHYLISSTNNGMMMNQSTVSPSAIHQDGVINSNSDDPLFGHHSSFEDHSSTLQFPTSCTLHKEDRLEQIIRNSGLHPFDYTKSENQITQWIQSKLREPYKGKMLTLWQETQNLFLTNGGRSEDGIEVEYQFKRNLITCSPILDTLPIPGCIWRRTGEIYKTNQEFDNLIGIKSSSSISNSSSSILSFLNNEFTSSNTTHLEFIKIHQLWDIDSWLNFTEKFNRIALDDGQKAVLTSCVLYRFREKSNDEEEEKENQPRPTTTTTQEMSSSVSVPTTPNGVLVDMLESETKPITSNATQDGVKTGEDTTQHHGSTTLNDDLTLESLATTTPWVSDGLFKSNRHWEIFDLVECTFSFTVCRDNRGLPCLIIGNFLPS